MLIYFKISVLSRTSPKITAPQLVTAYLGLILALGVYRADVHELSIVVLPRKQKCFKIPILVNGVVIMSKNDTPKESQKHHHKQPF
jgi:hypothetical protein